MSAVRVVAASPRVFGGRRFIELELEGAGKLDGFLATAQVLPGAVLAAVGQVLRVVEVETEWTSRRGAKLIRIVYQAEQSGERAWSYTPKDGMHSTRQGRQILDRLREIERDLRAAPTPGPGVARWGEFATAPTPYHVEQMVKA